MKHAITARVAIFGLLLASIAGCGDREDAMPVPSPEVATETASEARGVDAIRSGEARSAGGSWSVRWRSGPEGILPLEPFSLEVEVRDAEGRAPAADVQVSADASMPHHGHGMNFVPRTTSLGEGRYRIDGLLFHMRGRWELFVDVEDDGLLERAQWTLEVE